jgi:hypothetical protein
MSHKGPQTTVLSFFEPATFFALFFSATSSLRPWIISAHSALHIQLNSTLILVKCFTSNHSDHLHPLERRMEWIHPHA